MASSFGRRDFLKASAALAGTTATGGFVCIGSASAAPIEIPVVDRLAIRVLIDSAYDNAFTAKQLNGVTIQLAAALPDFAVNSVCPGWVRTEMGGANATRSVAEGASGIVWLAADAPQSLSGKFLRDRKTIAW